MFAEDFGNRIEGSRVEVLDDCSATRFRATSPMRRSN